MKENKEEKKMVDEKQKLEEEIKKLMNKIEEKEKELEEMKARYDEIREYAVSLKADFENYKTLVDKEKKNIYFSTKIEILKDLFKLYKALEIIIRNKSNTEKFVQAVELFYKSFIKFFESNEVVFISPKKGDPFDPFEHEATDKVETDEVEEYHVFELEIPGFKINGQVVEPAKVKVAIKPKKKEKVENEKKEMKDEENKKDE